MAATALLPLLLLALGGDPVAEAADRAQAARKSGDREALAGVAALDEPDPWLVAEELCGRGDHDAARALAEALGSPELLAAVERLRATPPPPATRELMIRIRDRVLAREWAAAAGIVPDPLPEPSDLTAILLVGHGGTALLRAGEAGRADRALGAAAAAAEAAGWLRRSSRFWLLRCDALRTSDPDGALECCLRAEQLARRGAPPAEHLLTQRILAGFLALGGRLKESAAAYAGALEGALRLGDKALASELALSAAVNESLVPDPRAAAALYRRAADLAREAGVRERRVLALLQLARGLQDLEGPLAADEACVEALEAAQGKERIPLLQLRSDLAVTRQDWPAVLERAAALAAAAGEEGDPAASASALSAQSVALSYLGKRQAAILSAEEAARGLDGVKDPKARRDLGMRLGIVLLGLGRGAPAIPMFAATADEESEPAEMRSMALALLSEARRMSGDAAGALANAGSALDLAGDDPHAQGRAWNAVGRAHLSLGDVASEIDAFERAVECAQRTGSPALVAESLDLLAGALVEALDVDKSLALYERALGLRRAAGHPLPVARALINLAVSRSSAGLHESAAAAAEEALLILEPLDRPTDEAIARSALGSALFELDRRAEAEAQFRRAIALAEESETGNPATPLCNLARLLIQRGERAEAERILRRAHDLAAPSDDARWIALGSLGRLALEGGRPGEAIPDLRAAAELVARRFDRLGEEQTARALEAGEHVFRNGFEAALRAGSAGDALYFAEMARGRALLVSLGGRSALRSAVVPEELRALERAAMEKRAHALRGLREALAKGERGEARAFLGLRDEAEEDLLEATARIQREARRAAGVYCPEAATAAALRGLIAPNEAIVVFAETAERHGAVILTRSEERVVDVAPLGASFDAATLFETFVEPLALPGTVTRVLLSPPVAGTLVPWCVALEGREVVFLPSATTYAFLRGEGGAGGGRILALGDPEPLPPLPGARPLPALPGARAEATAVGDLALLGKEATETAFRAALGREERWRAIHLACHGVVRTDRPALSSLLLAPDAAHDGLLSVREILELPLPAGLVVLSACETGQGRVVGGEGLFGFTRAVLYAGAPRVLVSLWKVDDDATGALMRKFYERWKGGRPAPAALRDAQTFVAAQERWKDPSFWAAWQLWGLGE